MNLKKSDAFRSEAVQLALTSGLTRKQVGADLGIDVPHFGGPAVMLVLGRYYRPYMATGA